MLTPRNRSNVRRRLWEPWFITNLITLVVAVAQLLWPVGLVGHICFLFIALINLAICARYFIKSYCTRPLPIAAAFPEQHESRD